MRRFLSFVLLVLMPLAAGAQESGRQRLLLVTPGSDSAETASAVHRLSGSTLPGWRATLNDSAVKVYPSGAFVGLLRLAVGENRFVLRADSADRSADSLVFRIFRRKPLESTPTDTLAIDSVLLDPVTEVWARIGEQLVVRCKGTTGCTASFLQGRPMTELAPEQTRGLRGIYEGTLLIAATDTFQQSPVVVRLTSPDGRFVERATGGTVTVVGRETPIVGVTRGEKPFFNFGLGGDRLGGAKMGFLVPGVRLLIDGRRGALYRAAISPDQEAWIPVEQVELLPPGTHPPFSLTGSWTVRGTSKEDIVSIELSERLPFTSQVELNPTRIHVDIHGAVSNTNWITQTLTSREISAVSYSVPARGVFRVTLQLRHKQVWGYAVDYQRNTLVITVRRPPEKLALRRLQIAVDAGHGGENEGAIGPTGSKEKDVNLATALHVKRLLEEEGARVMLTRSDDSASNNMDRLARVIASGADLLISIHSNSVGNASDPVLVSGVSTYYRHPWARPLSMAVLQEILKTGLVNFGNVGSFNFALNGPTELPTALVELAFMSHPEDEMKLLDDSFRREMAERIVAGVEEFLETCED